MPVVNVIRDDLFERLGEWFGAEPKKPSAEADKRFDELCFAFGIELDDVTSEKQMQKKETGVAAADASDDILYKIEIPANRYDLLCIEGIARALKIFLGKDSVPQYKVNTPQKLEQMIVKPEVLKIRPHVVCAILRGFKFNEKNYKSFIDLQEKLHQNVCRKRTLVSIGTHDLDTIKGPFTYEALPPSEIKFAPLNNTTVMDGNQLMAHLDNDHHLKQYLHIIRDSPVYPVIYDSNRIVLSLPPIINGNHSKITLNTKNVFIEVTATDATKAEVVLNTICAMFSEYCEDKYSAESVEIVLANGSKKVLPEFTPRLVEVAPHYINSSVGVNLPADEMAKIVSKMGITASVKSPELLQVAVPITRSDVFHACDVMEDVAIAYGYNNIKMENPKTQTVGKTQPLNKVSDLIRTEVALAGFTEILTFALCAKEELYKLMRRPDDGLCVTITNPQTKEFQVPRTCLLVSALKTLANNKDHSLPVKIFELSDVVLKTDKTDVGARNERRLVAVVCDKASAFEVVHGLLDRVMLMLRVAWSGAKDNNNTKHTYYLQPGEDPAFFPGMCANVIFDNQKIGTVGVLHPEVLKNYGIPNPCSVFEINIEPFV
mmetsp:Transcript_1844/g.2374  ORF Transcript_1844/g.2374 Transcript_1844/m.2374 type:complete len:602 (-) Transcript_1844:48-1853(-)